MAVAQLVDPVCADSPAEREQAPEKDASGLRVPLDPCAPAPAPLRERGGIAEHDQPSTGSRSSGTSTAYFSGTQTHSASAPHTVSAATRSPTRRLELPGPSSSTTPTSS